MVFYFRRGWKAGIKRGQKVYFPDYPFKAVIFKNFLFTQNVLGMGLFGIAIGFSLPRFTGPNCIFDRLENTLARSRYLLFVIPAEARIQECFDQILVWCL
jgi:hypothetical protein